MERHIKKEDIYVVLALLDHVAKSRERNMQEIWYLQENRTGSLESWSKASHNTIVRQKTRMNDEIYTILSSEVMKMKYPKIKEIEKKEVTLLKKSAMILIMMGMPVHIISSILITSNTYIHSIIQQHPEIFG